ncbi:MAG: hypothetical protein PQ612_04245 [Rickettsiales bacterium]|nr:hypothetical protein [Pseudomonadota bacterium]MDA0966176.1 hypothetical protein [Pseudomonadota bacterium]MDG4543159.1 hypothetical protein [Rickettsiales bacterium]MDG4545357.1 hypothetical protein [Rickettsiales bacterium]
MVKRKFFTLALIIIALIINNNSYAQKVERGMGGGFLYHLFAAPEPDFEFENIDEIKEYMTPDLPVQNKEEFIKLALTNKNIQGHIFLSVSDSHKDLGWKVFVDKKEGGWLIKMRSKMTVPEYRCYFGINENGEEVDLLTSYKGCKYYSNK